MNTQRFYDVSLKQRASWDLQRHYLPLRTDVLCPHLLSDQPEIWKDSTYTCPSLGTRGIVARLRQSLVGRSAVTQTALAQQLWAKGARVYRKQLRV